MGNFWSDLLRNIFGWLDSIIYGFVDNVYNTFTNIANYTLINSNVIDTFTKRIYILIGVFMLFKMAFSLINYFVDPDKFMDSKTGFGNLIQRIVISLVLLVLVPSIFNIAFYAQTIVLNENILANIVLGGTYDDTGSKDFIDTYENAGKKMAFTVLSAFMYPKDTGVMSMTQDQIKEEFGDDTELIESYTKYHSAQADNSVDALVGMNGVKNNEDANGNYLYQYIPGLSTLAGVMVLWILFIFCIDIGVRAVKLVFLQLVAPIPVLSYIDATKGKDIFNKWVQECIKTYLDVFIRLLAIYFVIFIITLITNNGFTVYTYVLKNGTITTEKVQDVDMFAQALIILGLLIFAGEAPKLIGDLFGIKLGDFSLNPMKRISKSPLAAGVVGGAVAGITGGISSAYGNYHTNRQLGNKVGKSLLSGAGGLFSGAARGMKTGASEKSFGGAISKGMGISGKSANRILEKQNTGKGITGMWNRGIARAQTKLGLQTQGTRMEKQLKAYNDFNSNMGKLKTAAGKKLDKEALSRSASNFKYGKNADGSDKIWNGDINIGQQRALVDSMTNRDTSNMNDAEQLSFANQLAEEKAKLVAAENTVKKEIMKEMTTDFNNGNLADVDDSDAVAALSAMRDAINDEPSWFQHVTYEDNLGNEVQYNVDMSDVNAFIDDAGKNVGSHASVISTSDEYKTATAVNDYAKNASSGGSKK